MDCKCKAVETTEFEKPQGYTARCLIGVIRGYQLFLSGMSPGCCRFSPSCSEYACQSIASKGVVVGVFLALRRLLKCHPWGPLDPDDHK